jgi:hypothetical protein
MAISIQQILIKKPLRIIEQKSFIFDVRKCLL